MSEVLINIPDEIQSKIEIQANLQGLSISTYIEKLVKVKAFSATLDTMRMKISDFVKSNNILNEDDLNRYLKS